MKHMNRILAALLSILMLPLFGSTAYATESNPQDGTGEALTEDYSIDLPKFDLKLTLPSEYYFCYEDNIKEYKDYFTEIGWNYRETVKTIKEQGIELFAFQINLQEFYVIVDDSAYDTFGGVNLKDLNDEERERAMYTYTGTYFHDYSMYDRNTVDAVETDQAWYVVATYLDYNDAENPVPIAEYWTILNGRNYRFMMYGVNENTDFEYCLTELERIMDTVEFTNIMPSEEVDKKVKDEKTAETVKIVLVSVGTLAGVALIFIIIIFISKSKNKLAQKKLESSIPSDKEIKKKK